jgi:hypothetical protein
MPIGGGRRRDLSRIKKAAEAMLQQPDSREGVWF